VPEGVQHRRVGVPAHKSPEQHSDDMVQPVVPAARQVLAARQMPAIQLAPPQHSAS